MSEVYLRHTSLSTCEEGKSREPRHKRVSASRQLAGLSINNQVRKPTLPWENYTPTLVSLDGWSWWKQANLQGRYGSRHRTRKKRLKGNDQTPWMILYKLHQSPATVTELRLPSPRYLSLHQDDDPDRVLRPSLIRSHALLQVHQMLHHSHAAPAPDALHHLQRTP